MPSFSQPHYLKEEHMIFAWLRKAVDKGIAEFNPSRNSYRIKTLQSLVNVIKQYFGKIVTDRTLLSKLDQPPYKLYYQKKKRYRIIIQRDAYEIIVESYQRREIVNLQRSKESNDNLEIIHLKNKRNDRDDENNNNNNKHNSTNAPTIITNPRLG